MKFLISTNIALKQNALGYRLYRSKISRSFISRFLQLEKGMEIDPFADQPPFRSPGSPVCMGVAFY